MHFAAALWIGFGAVALVVIGGVLLLRHGPSENLGAVSDQWVMHHRATPGDDTSR